MSTASYSSIATLLALLSLGVVPAVHAIDYSDEYEESTPRMSTLTLADKLDDDAARARSEQLPLMIKFSTSWCTYCRALEEQVLEPMLKSGDYDDKVILRKVMVDDGERMRDFDGDEISTSRFANHAGVELYPTIVFYDGNGREISERIVGVTVLDYVPQYIDEALERAARELQ